ncbi:MAG: TRAP transporter large permease [Rhodobiaceae bacterium]|nr:TRAP transporter large permease [Rhodobiaceae bacterium]MCC0055341.1 TRAP transporter large permease [Rhodobiaceae bacterium]
MDASTIGLLGMIGLLVLVMWGVPIGFALSAVGLTGLWALAGQGPALSQATMVFWHEGTNFVLIAIPMFVLMGNIVRHTGIASDLFTCGSHWFGRLPGGLAIASVFGCAGFGAITGSSAATVSTMGKIVIPEMRRFNYNLELGAGALSASGTLGILIPPSLIFIFYGSMTDNSIGKLFIAGIVPGIMTAVIFSLVIYGRCLINKDLGPATPDAGWGPRLRSLSALGPILGLFGLVVGGLYFGIFTPTEASGIGVIGVLAYAVITRRITMKALREAVEDTILTTVMLFAIIVGGYLIARFLVLTGITAQIIGFVSGLDLNPYVFILLLSLMYIVLGMLLDVFGMMILTIPFVYPVVVHLGFDPIWFGVYVVIMAEIALITPPIGVNVFIMRSVTPELSTERIFRGVMPFFAAELVIVALLVAFPSIALVLLP